MMCWSLEVVSYTPQYKLSFEILNYHEKSFDYLYSSLYNKQSKVLIEMHLRWNSWVSRCTFAHYYFKCVTVNTFLNVYTILCC